MSLHYLYRFGASQLLPAGAPVSDAAGGRVPSDAQRAAGDTVHYGYGTSGAVIPLGLHKVRHRGIYSSSVLANVEAMAGLIGTYDDLWRAVSSPSTLQWKKAKLLRCDWRRSMEQYDHAVLDLEFDAWGPWKEQTVTQSSRTSTGSMPVLNDGDAHIFDVFATFTASSTGTHTFRIDYTVAGQTVDWTWSGTVNNTEIVRIDAGALAVTNDGDDAYDDFTLSAAHDCQNWMLLAPGTNNIQFTLSAGAGTFEINHYDSWI